MAEIRIARNEIADAVDQVIRDLKARDEVQTNIIHLDQRGHRFHNRPSPNYVKADIDHVRRMVDLVPEYGLRGALHISHTCTYCGQRPGLHFDDNNVIVADTECPATDGVLMVNEIAVPSGKIIVCDHLMEYSLKPHDVDENLDYNTAQGQAQFVEAMFAAGCAYGPVGNSCPSLYKTGEGTYVIGNPSYDEDTDEANDEELGELLANVCTDLWAYSIADYDDWTAKGGKVESWTETVVEIPAGTYRFTHHTGERGFDGDSSGITIYAHIEKVD